MSFHHLFLDITITLLERAAKNKICNKISKSEYPAKLKTFAFNLYFYSPKAYDYLRTVFEYALPHANTILKWLSSTDANPGFLDESFRAIETFVKSSGSSLLDGFLPCSFISDEISIKKKLDLVTGTEGIVITLKLNLNAFQLFSAIGKKLYGTVDLGDFQLDSFDETRLHEEATEVLVFMVNLVVILKKIFVNKF